MNGDFIDASPPGTGSYALEPQCGRPKGMKVDARGDLVVVDAYKGILRVDLDTGHVETLLDSEYYAKDTDHVKTAGQ